MTVMQKHAWNRYHFVFFYAACQDNFVTSTKKTGVMSNSAPNQVYRVPKIVLEDEELKPIQRFKWLGIKLSDLVTVDDELIHHITQNSAAFGAIHKNL